MSDRAFSLPAVLLLCVSAYGIAAPPSGEAERTMEREASVVEQSAVWKMESLHRADGKVFHGLLLAMSDEEIEFIEVKRPPGKKWYLVIHNYPAKSVESIARIDKAEREQLLGNIRPLLENKSHARIEAGRIEDVALEEIRRDGSLFRRFDGDLFTLESTADDETTRRCVVRIEQVMRAYRFVLPSRTQREDKLRVLVQGSMDAYHTELKRRKLSVDNPAVYYAEQNLIIAGSELTRFAERVAQVRDQNAELRKQYETLNKSFPARLRQLAADLKEAGFSGTEIESEVRARTAAWKREFDTMLAKISEVNRRNDAKFSEATRGMFQRLYHEAFHAYLENCVFPHNRFSAPRWLNEGLAQVFEGGQLEAGTLRIDQPDRTLLKQLQADLAGGRPLPLADLLSSRERSFLVTHNADESSVRHYLYAWGLAHYLTFEQDLLGADKLEKYVANESAKLPPIERFEKLVGISLPEFEHQWRAAMLAMPVPPR